MKSLRAILGIVLAGAILLFFDLENRQVEQDDELVKIAIFKINSRLILDQTEQGILKSLEERGIVDGDKYSIKHYCAEGDMPTANMIAQNIVSSEFDMVISISTPALQTMANANKEGRVTHVFCAVTDPYIAGVGIDGPGSHQHPEHLVGIGTFQPVAEAFDLAVQMNPKLKKVGTVWCTSEVCSEACVLLARAKCKELGIELLEMGVETSTQVLETAMSLTSRGVEALWLGGDNVVESGLDQLITAAEKAQIPLFTNNPYKVYGNALFGLGAKYYDVGQIAGTMAVDILEGKPTNTIGIKNVVPNNLVLNDKALSNISSDWDISKFAE